MPNSNAVEFGVSSPERFAIGTPRVFLSMASPGGPAQEAFISGLLDAVANHDMTPVLVTGARSSSAPLAPIRRVMQTCTGTIVIAMARTRVIEGVDYSNGGDGQRYRDRYLATEWVQIESALAYELGHSILVLRENLVHPAGLLDPAASGFDVCTFSLRRSATDDRAQIGRTLSAFRARLREPAVQVRRGQ